MNDAVRVPMTVSFLYIDVASVPMTASFLYIDVASVHMNNRSYIDIEK
jgi:hypothetical protein